MKRLEGKVALISGTARGQGRAAALRFAEGPRGNPLADAHPVNGISRHVPLERAGQPDDVVNTAVSPASAEAAYITGANLVVGGGWSTVLPGAPS